MKNWITLLLGLILLVMAVNADIEFHDPDFDFPFYQMIFTYDLDIEGALLKEVSINQTEWTGYTVFKDGRQVSLNKPLERGNYSFVLDFAWRNDKEYYLEAHFQLPETTSEAGKTHVYKTKGRSPNKGGIPLGEEGFYRVFYIEEPVNIERQGELVELVFTVEKNPAGKDHFLLTEGIQILDFQILDIQENVAPEKASTDHPSTLTYKIVFPLDMDAGGIKQLMLLRGTGKAQEKKGFIIEPTGEGIGKTVRGKRLVLEFHQQNGQINSFLFIDEKVKLYNEAGVVHWNPGIFIPGVAWDHSFNWKSAPNYEELSGPYFYVNSRRGPFQTIKDADLEVRYSLPIDAPYLISETRITVNKNLAVKAVRNDEMVLYKELFDTLIYKNKLGEIVKMPLKERKGYPDGFVCKTYENSDWVGLLNTDEEYGFFSLRIDYANSCCRASGDWLYKSGTYFYAPSDGKYVYWVRPLLYTWSEYPTRNLLTHVPKGSMFYEKNAYILLPLEEGFEKKLDVLLLTMKNPLKVY